MVDLKLISKREEPKINISVSIYKSIYDRLITVLKRENVTMSALWRHMLNTFLEEQERQEQERQEQERQKQEGVAL